MDKQKGWEINCARCQMWISTSGGCSAENSNGKCPCEVMSKKQFDYLAKQAEED